jgi:hypothetical protein
LHFPELAPSRCSYRPFVKCVKLQVLFAVFIKIWLFCCYTILWSLWQGWFIILMLCWDSIWILWGAFDVSYVSRVYSVSVFMWLYFDMMEFLHMS